ncbi:hypothetical protein N9937_02290, partial [bacterium]|nr:hypothetical protein [bacterium]
KEMNWLQTDDDELRLWHKRGAGVRTIGMKMLRTTVEVQLRMDKLRLKTRNRVANRSRNGNDKPICDPIVRDAYVTRKLQGRRYDDDGFTPPDVKGRVMFFTHAGFTGGYAS